MKVELSVIELKKLLGILKSARVERYQVAGHYSLMYRTKPVYGLCSLINDLDLNIHVNIQNLHLGLYKLGLLKRTNHVYWWASMCGNSERSVKECVQIRINALEALISYLENKK